MDTIAAVLFLSIPAAQDYSFQDMLDSIHRIISEAFRRTEVYARSFDDLTQSYVDNAKFAKVVSVR